MLDQHDLTGILQCPQCGAPLELIEFTKLSVVCGSCGQLFHSYTGVLDLRLRQPKTANLSIIINNPHTASVDVRTEVLKRNPTASVDFCSVYKPDNISHVDLSYFPKASSPNSLALDLGGGQGEFQEVIERSGFRYIGMDFSNPATGLLADAHAMPFRDSKFEFVWCNSVFQYLEFAQLAMTEVSRVMQPNATFMGTIGFLEPFDSDNVTMFSEKGVVSLLQFGGFEIEVVAPDSWWTGLVALIYVGLFPRLPLPASRALALPLEFASKAWWRIACTRNKRWSTARRLAKVTAGYTFIARKPG